MRQGCILSPILFVIFIDGLVRAVKRARVSSVLKDIKFNILLFDDVVLLAESRHDLQVLLDAAYGYGQKWRFNWNCAKSKVLRFSSRKVQNHHYFLGFQKLELVKSYTGWQLHGSQAWQTGRCGQAEMTSLPGGSWEREF